MLERVARRLVAAGATRLVVNVCPFADRIQAFVEEKGGFGAEVVLSREEPAPLETGGGFAKASRKFVEDGPILLHNVDVLTDLPLRDLLAAHEKSQALATLAVAERPSRRRLVFDAQGLLGKDEEGKPPRRARTVAGALYSLPFAGVSVVARNFAGLVSERGAFSIVEPWLRLSGQGHRVLPFRVDAFRWCDVGSPETLDRAHALAREMDAATAA
jgi:NDP-sugar pyrophosphorylase family protein